MIWVIKIRRIRQTEPAARAYKISIGTPDRER
jgi:hypothetical protein